MRFANTALPETSPQGNHGFAFDPTYGLNLEQLLAVSSSKSPDDFAEFWRRTYREAREVPLQLSSRQVESPRRGYDVFELEFSSLGGVRIGAWVTVPHGQEEGAGWVVGHGYGARTGPSFEGMFSRSPAIFPCARGLGRSAQAGIPDVVAEHVLHGIGSRETYVHRGCVADLWAAASALSELFPNLGTKLRYAGGSFGGGIGAMALPWDDRFSAGYLDVPSFGNHPLRLTLPCIGSGEAVRQHVQRHPEVRDVLAYFDASIAAQFLTIPTFVAAALLDPAVPPPGQFAVYNAIPGNKELYVRSSGHMGFMQEARESLEIEAALMRWLPWHSTSQVVRGLTAFRPVR